MYAFGAVLTWAICLTFLAAVLGLVWWVLFGLLKAARRYVIHPTAIGLREALDLIRGQL